jgi:hypothetical protein
VTVPKRGHQKALVRVMEVLVVVWAARVGVLGAPPTRQPCLTGLS